LPFGADAYLVIVDRAREIKRPPLVTSILRKRAATLVIGVSAMAKLINFMVAGRRLDSWLFHRFCHQSMRYIDLH